MLRIDHRPKAVRVRELDCPPPLLLLLPEPAVLYPAVGPSCTPYGFVPPFWAGKPDAMTRRGLVVEERRERVIYIDKAQVDTRINRRKRVGWGNKNFD